MKKMRNTTGRTLRDQEGHSIRPGATYYEEGHVHKKIHCVDCYEKAEEKRSSLREEIEDDVLEIGSMAAGAALGLGDDDDSSSTFGGSGDSDSGSDDSFGDGDFGGGGGGDDC